MNNKWEPQRDGLTRVYNFKTFLETFGFATQIALVAQRLNHHPTLIIEYNRVTVKTSTHDEGNSITDRDLKLAEAIDNLQLPAGKKEAEELKLMKQKVKKTKKEEKKQKKEWKKVNKKLK